MRRKGSRSGGISSVAPALPPCLPSPCVGLCLVFRRPSSDVRWPSPTPACFGTKDQRHPWKVSVQTGPLGLVYGPLGGDLAVSWEQPRAGSPGVSPGLVLRVRAPLISRGIGGFPVRLLCAPYSHGPSWPRSWPVPPLPTFSTEPIPPSAGGRTAPLDAQAWEFIGVMDAQPALHSQLHPHPCSDIPGGPRLRAAPSVRSLAVVPSALLSHLGQNPPSPRLLCPFSLLCGLVPFPALAAC